MRLDMTCDTCKFCTNADCHEENECEDGAGCDDWDASFEYYSKIVDDAPWYIREQYKRYRISYYKFLDLLIKDEQGIGIEINIYDAIEKIYNLTSWELAEILNVSRGVLGYARTRKTVDKRKKQFSDRLHIPQKYFNCFLSTQLEELKQFKKEFYEFYGADTIARIKQKALDVK